MACAPSSAPSTSTASSLEALQVDDALPAGAEILLDAQRELVRSARR